MSVIVPRRLSTGRMQRVRVAHGGAGTSGPPSSLREEHETGDRNRAVRAGRPGHRARRHGGGAVEPAERAAAGTGPGLLPRVRRGGVRPVPAPGPAVRQHRAARGGGGAGLHPVRRRHAHRLAAVPGRGRRDRLARGRGHVRDRGGRRGDGGALPVRDRLAARAAARHGAVRPPTRRWCSRCWAGARSAGAPASCWRASPGPTTRSGIALLVGAARGAPARPGAAIGHIAVTFVLQMAVGAAMGIAGGWLLLEFMRRVPLPNEGLYALRTLARCPGHLRARRPWHTGRASWPSSRPAS